MQFLRSWALAPELQPFSVMSNTRVGFLIGSGVATGIAVVYAAKTRRRNRSLLARTRRQAYILKHQAEKLRDSAADLIEKGIEEAERRKKELVQAVEAGKAAYHRLAH